MGRKLSDVIGGLPAERQEKIAALAEKKVNEMIAHATTLTDFRKAVGLTQAEVAEKLGIKQNAVSQLEQRSDTYVSTLRRYLQSLDITLELSVVSKNGTRIPLPNFHPWDEPAPRKGGTTLATTVLPAAVTRRPAMRQAANKPAQTAARTRKA